ncbi:2OG-Fe dioxygenase family protein [Xenorhabdus eapokensis]|uniref:L-isoleucine-4-hydroxylase n=1 Tax=Xenorhabdus eapokensis TaxID=1873482 RepID=A0A1Q5TT97_9GAMM|nr:2OG-Fe dioxygenase family protein [Xenorhabdus eapokensis]OKP03449.1 L-isoleucine-4-hydroxylase [Xenorhabdus eapokensis]
MFINVTNNHQNITTNEIKTNIIKEMKDNNFVYLKADHSMKLINKYIKNRSFDIDKFVNSWNKLELDKYMGDGGQYRRRRYSTLSSYVNSKEITLEPHQSHFQTKHYNNLNGDIERHYEPIKDEIIKSEIMQGIFHLSHDLFTELSPKGNWHIETHQFRIEVTDSQIGKPTPEGIHRDGVDYVFMLCINRINCIGGESTIYDKNKNKLISFTMKNAFELVMLNDKELFHGVSSISRKDKEKKAVRDMLVITFRKK